MTDKPMTVGELKLFIKDLPDDMQLQYEDEGDSFDIMSAKIKPNEVTELNGEKTMEDFLVLS